MAHIEPTVKWRKKKEMKIKKKLRKIVKKTSGNGGEWGEVSPTFGPFG